MLLTLVLILLKPWGHHILLLILLVVGIFVFQVGLLILLLAKFHSLERRYVFLIFIGLWWEIDEIILDRAKLLTTSLVRVFRCGVRFFDRLDILRTLNLPMRKIAL